MAKQPRVLAARCQKPGSWNESQITKAISRCGYVLGEIKEDGFRFHAYIQDGEVRIITREGIEIRSLENRKRHLRGLLETLPAGFYVDGEVVIPDIPFSEASGILRRFEALPAEGGHITMFHVWDASTIAALTGTQPDPTPYKDRKAFLVHQMQAVPYPSIFVRFVTAARLTSIAACHEFFEFARGLKKEGAVIKTPDDGTKNGKVAGWWKLKPEDTCDGHVVGLVWGTPGLSNEGKVIGFKVVLENGVQTNVTGITQDQMREFTEVVIQHNGGAHVQFLRDFHENNPYHGRYIEIEFMEYTEDGSLRHGNFVRFRDLEYALGIKA